VIDDDRAVSSNETEKHETAKENEYSDRVVVLYHDNWKEIEYPIGRVRQGNARPTMSFQAS
jgi:hypothetical protein